MLVSDLSQGLGILEQAYRNDIESAIVDDFNSESASVIIYWEEGVNLKSLNAKIKRFFKYFMDQDVFPGEFGLERGFYMFDLCYAYSSREDKYLAALSNENEKQYIKNYKKGEI